jgi:hypothetical protein
LPSDSTKVQAGHLLCWLVLQPCASLCLQSAYEVCLQSSMLDSQHYLECNSYNSKITDVDVLLYVNIPHTSGRHSDFPLKAVLVEYLQFPHK